MAPGRFSSAVAVVLSLVGPGFSQQQEDRRDRHSPELIIEAGGRQGPCDRLVFTADGRHLLAAGDDKVVRIWDYDKGKLIAPPGRGNVLRWDIWRQRRGNIYALALSPNRRKRHVAIGGIGTLINAKAAAILDRETGEVLFTAVFARPDGSSPTSGSVRALAFSPDGSQVAAGTADGSVWLWRPWKDPKEQVVYLGSHRPVPGKQFNRVRLLHFTRDDQVLSVAQSGEALQWDLSLKEPMAEPLPLFESMTVFTVALSPDGQWLAAAGEEKDARVIAIRSLTGAKKDVTLKWNQFCRALAFSPDGDRLALSIGSKFAGAGSWFLEADDVLCYCDLQREKLVLEEGPRHHGRAECLAFHPTEPYLAVAGGDNHEVTLWSVPAKRFPQSVMRSAGSGLWGVALAKNNTLLAFQEHRDPTATHPNERGSGKWRVFHLLERTWQKKLEDRFEPPAAPASRGWRIEPDLKDPYLWYAVQEAAPATKHPLHLDNDADQMPRCYTFLPARPRQGVRVAIGHTYGLSVFELSRTGAKRIWRGIGHQGEVTAMAASEKGDLLVSASTDQTIAAWPLKDWASHSELAATFQVRKERPGKNGLYLADVELFGPAWEAGLKAGDKMRRVSLFEARNESPSKSGPRLEEVVVYDEKDAGPLEMVPERLLNLQSGREVSFRFFRPSTKKALKTTTTLPRRPLWRFFPTRGGDWVVWVNGYHYYDASTLGDQFLGWHLNHGEKGEKTPRFYEAEKFSKRFYNPEFLDRLLGDGDLRKALEEERQGDRGLLPPNFEELEPVPVQVTTELPKRPDDKVKITVRVHRRSDNPDYKPYRGELWINDYRAAKPEADELQLAEDGSFEKTYEFDSNVLCQGKNQVLFQVYNQIAGFGEGRSEGACVETYDPPVKRKPRLWVVAVGIWNYKQSPAGLADLPSARSDAKMMAELWAQQVYRKGFQARDVRSVLGDGTSDDREQVLGALQRVAKLARADDHFLLFLAGHGDVQKIEGKSHFVFCCGGYDPKAARATGILDEELSRELASIRCRKTLFVDTCRAGEISPVRPLLPGGHGPTIFAACDTNQQSYGENIPGGHGLFTLALRDAFLDKFDEADANHDGVLDLQELATFVKARVRTLQEQGKDVPKTQTPVVFPTAPDATALFQRARLDR